MGPFDVLVLTIGEPGHMDEEAITKSVVAYKMALFNNPKIEEVHIVIGGYDEDPREVWEIPRAKAYIRRWAAAAEIHTLSQAIAGHIHMWSIGVLARCGALDDVKPENVRAIPWK